MALTPDQRRLADRFGRLRLDSAAALYRDACALMAAPASYESASHFVSHALRDIESAIRQALKPILMAGQKARGANGDAKHAWEIQGIATALDPTGALEREWRAFVGFDEGLRLHARAHRNDLDPARPVDPDFEAFWDRANAFLVRVVDAIERAYPLVMRHVRERVGQAAPTVAHAKELTRTLLRSEAAFGLFFEELRTPAWLPVLVEAGVFDRPPDRGRDEARGATWYPAWPPSRVLRRVAGDDGWPDEDVAAAVRAVPLTNNQDVVGDLVDVARALPGGRLADWASTWLVEFLDGLDTPLHFNRFADVSGLAAHLASAGWAEEALTLARALYRLSPGPEVEDDEPFGRTREPETRAGWSFYYRDGLTEDVPTLAAAAPWETLEFLADLVDTYAEETTDEPAPLDGSEHWVDDVGADDDGSSLYETGGWLARALCQTAVGMVASGHATVQEAVDWLRGRGRHAYIRCALAVLREHGSAEEVAEALTDRTRVYEDALREETLRLIETRLGALDEGERHRVLDLLAAGPDPQDDLRRAERYGWEGVTEERAHERAGWVREHWLGRLRPVLPADWVEAHADLFPTDRAPEPEGPDPSQAVRERIEATMAADPAAGLDLLADWAALEHRPGVEATAFSLERAVRADRAAFAAVADRLIGADATFVHALAKGLGDAGSGDETEPAGLAEIDWAPVLRLLAWAVRRPREIEGRRLPTWDRDGDPPWGWARKRIARLLERAVWADAVPWALRDAVWEVVRAITDDPDPEPKEDGETSGRDAYGRAINSTRGDAMAAAFAVVAWAHRETGDAPASVPDVFAVLDTHLDPEVDPSPAVRAMYGVHLPLLVEVARGWAERRRDALFPEAGPLREGMWNGYGRVPGPTQRVVDWLRPTYLDEIRGWTGADLVEVVFPDEPAMREERVRGDVRERVDEVVDAVLLATAGVDAGDLGDALFGHPDGAVRALAVERVGRVLLSSWRGFAPGPIGERAGAAWERAKEAGLTAEVGAAFALWAPVEGFGVGWTLAELDAALASSGGEALDGYRLVEWLAGAGEGDPEGAVGILDRLSRSDGGPGYIRGEADATRAVLRAALAAGGRAAVLARETAGRLTIRTGIDFTTDVDAADEDDPEGDPEGGPRGA